MNRTLLMTFALVCLSTACDNSVDVQGLDVAIAGAEKPKAFFATDVVSYDTDLDGVDDRSIDWLNLVITEDEDLCDRINQASDLSELHDVSAVIMTVATTQGLDSETLSSNSSFSDLSTWGGTWAAARVLERVDGETIVDAYSDSAMGGSGAGQVMLDINGRSGEAPHYITISASWAADLAFDAEGNDVSGRAEGAFFLAGYCQALVE